MANRISETTERLEELGRRAAEGEFAQRQRAVAARTGGYSLLDELRQQFEFHPTRTVLFGVGIALLAGALLVRR